MNNLYRLLTKILLITFIFIVSILLMTLIGLKIVFGLIFFYLAGKIWAYKPQNNIKIEANQEEKIIDYYKFFNILENSNSEDIETAYKRELLKLVENLTLNLSSKNEIMEQIDEGYKILINEDSKASYNKKLSMQKQKDETYFEKVRLEKIQNEKFYFKKELMAMLKFN
ncbi:hypothetical protein [Flavobacterium sp.]|uniref:hypothetical protein n=1 Tax=Flavobacterium sp. TaxID=239 RepID=UPI001B72B734|nr:hypothetical protein [Flavobacterium sp.]MBP6128234.1 hypothetical protein [Flavobacterium sp.]